jgi:hypothetical protein
MVTFDGETCQVEGPDTAPAGRVYFNLDNQSDSQARIGLFKVNAGLDAAEVLAATEPGSGEYPDGTTFYNGTGSVLAGKVMSDNVIEVEPGEYIVACGFVTPEKGYPGAVLTITE